MSMSFWRRWLGRCTRFCGRGGPRKPCRKIRPTFDPLEARLVPAQVVWIGNAGGFWDVPGNWRDDQGLNRVPNRADDDVLIDVPGGDFAITHRQGSSTVRSILSSEPVVLSGGTLAATGSFQVNNAFTLSGGTLANTAVPGAMTIQGSSGTLRGVTLHGNASLSGWLYVTNGLTLHGTLNLGNAAGTTSGNLYFNGTQTLDGTGRIVLGASVGNDMRALFSEQVLTIGPGITVQGGSGRVGTTGATLVNQGTILADSAGRTLRVTGARNEGIIQAGTGAILTLEGAWNNTGQITATEATVNLDGTFSRAGLGTFRRTGGTVNLAGILDNGGSTLALDDATGPWRLASGGTLRGGRLTTSGTAMLVGAGGTLDAVTVDGVVDVAGQSGSIDVVNGLTLNGVVNLGNDAGTTWGNLYFSGTQTLAGNGRVVVGTNLANSVRPRSSGQTLTIAPGVTVQGSSGLLGATGATLINQGTISAESAGRALRVSGFRNEGTLSAVNGASLTLEGPWSNVGQINVTDSTVNLGGTFTLADLGALRRVGGTVNLTGTLDNSGGTFALDDGTGSWRLATGGILRGGRLTTSGSATLVGAEGTLDGVTLDGVLDLSSRSGSARVINGLTLNSTLHLGNATGSTNGELSFSGTQALTGTGRVVLGSSVSNELRSNSSGQTLTIGPDITVQGGSGRLGTTGATLVNQATITAESAGRTLRVSGLRNEGTVSVGNGASLTLDGAWSNAGQITATGATVNLDGTFTAAGLGDFRRVGGTVNLAGILDNTDNALVLNDATGSWRLSSGGILRGGRVATAGSATLRGVGGTLDAVTIDEVLDLSGSVYVTDGLTLNGTLSLGNAAGTTSADLSFNGTQALTGTGLVVLGASSSNDLASRSSGQTLTIGPDISVEGGSGELGTRGATLISQGPIVTDKGTIQLSGTVNINETSGLSSQPEGSFTVTGDLLGDIRNANSFTPRGTTRLSGSGTSERPQLLEVMSADRGADQAAFAENFAYGSLTVSSYVRLVDQSDNAAGTEPEALYVDALVVSRGDTLDLNGYRVYARTARIDGTVLGNVEQIPDRGPIEFGASASGSIAVAGELDEWTFTGRQGQSVAILVNPGTAITPAPVSPTLQWADVRLLDANGTVLAQGRSTTTGQAVALLDVTLPVEGTYRIQVRGVSGSVARTGNYLVTLQNSTADVARLTLNESASGRIEAPTTVDRWTFAATAGQVVQLDVLGAAPGIRFQLTAPGGSLVFTDLTADSGLVNLPLSGEYVLTASSGTGQAGDYSFRLVTLSTIDLTLGLPYQGTLAGSGQFQLFRVQVPGVTPLSFQLDDAGAGNRNHLYVSQAVAPTRSNAQYRAEAPAADQNLLVPLAAPGTWYVLVSSDVVTTPGSFTLTATAQPLVLSGVTPDSVPSSGDAVLTVTGAGFTAGTTVQLVSGRGTFGGAVELAAPDRLIVRFALTAPSAGGVLRLLEPGTYALRVTRPDGTSAQVDNALTIVNGGQPRLETQLFLPAVLGNHVSAQLFVEYANRGDVAMPAPVLILHASNNGLLTLDASRVTPGLWTFEVPEGYSDTVQILASGATPGLLQPGESIRVPVYWGGKQRPWVGGSVDFQLTVSTGFDLQPVPGRPGELASQPVPIDWNALRDSMRPASISPEAWGPIFTNFVQQVGTTWADYVGMLNDNAAYLGRLGQRVYDVSRLVAFELAQASGLHPVRTLASSIDAAVEAPGLGLGLERTYANSILGHYELGLFGRGWHTSWEDLLVTQPDGSLYITGAAGAQRRFNVPQDTLIPSRIYEAEPGDRGTLSRRADGTFELREATGLLRHFRADGLLDYMEDLNGNRITAEHTGNRLTRLTHSAGQSLTLDYNAAGRIASITDSEAEVTRYTYDAAGEHLTTVQLPDGRSVRYTYATGAGAAREHALTSAVSPSGVTRTFDYDGAGRLASTSLPGNAERVQFVFDSAGAVTVQDAAGSSKVYFDHRGLIVQSEDPLGRVARLTFDDQFHLTRLTDAAGLHSDFAYDADGNLVRVTDPLGQTTQLAYSQGVAGIGIDRLTALTDARGNTTRYGYDARGNRTSTTYANGTVERIAYDAQGNPDTFTNRRGQVIDYLVNAAGQVTRKVFADGSEQTYTYDAHGNLATATDPDVSVTFTYDAGNRLTRVNYSNGRFLEYAYDAGGRRIRMTDQDGFTVNYAHDAAGRLERLTDAAGGLIVRYGYDAAGRLVREDKGNGTFTTYEYDAAGQLLHLVNRAPNGTVNSRFDYAYDVLGRRTSMATLDGTWTYEYDALGQLTHAVFASINSTIPSQDLRYSYDAVGNRIQTIENGVTTDYVTNNLNQYTRVGTSDYAYDADGNLTSITDAAGTTQFTWDNESRLVGVSGSTGAWSYVYDALGNRAAGIANGQRTEYLVDPTGLGNVVGEYSGAGNLARYTHGLGLVSRAAATGTAYFDFDAIGSTVGLSGTAGSYLNRYSYQPFGERLLASETIANPFEFVGQSGVMQENNGLDFMRARYYSPESGRFTSLDPIGLRSGDVNWYRYVFNSPVRFNDPSGLALPVILGGVIAGEVLLDAAIATGIIGAGILGGIAIEDITWPDLPGLPDTWPGSDTWPGGDAGRIGPRRPGRPGEGVTQPGLPPPVHPGTPWEGIPDTPPFDFPWWPHNGFIPLPPGEPGDEGDSGSANSSDPNALTGPAGFGPANFVRGDGVFPYRIDFENDATATAPAQRVDVFNQLDARLDWDTFEFTEFGFGSTIITIPAGSRHFRTTLPMRWNDRDFQVEIELDFNTQTGQVLASFRSLDPQTNLPPDVLTGFLPPEDGSGRGMGHIGYVVRPDAGLATGTEIRNIARIRFDFGEIIETNQVDPHDPSRGTDPAKEALITIDAGAPTSSVTPLPATTASANFVVSWAGSDDAGGSGIANYDVYVSDNGGPFTRWLANTTARSATFAGQVGHTYQFRSLAVDNVGRRQETPGLETMIHVEQPVVRARGLIAQLVTKKVGRNRILFVQVRFADTGELRSEFRSPFQKPAYRSIVVSVLDGTIVVTGRKGSKVMKRTTAV